MYYKMDSVNRGLRKSWIFSLTSRNLEFIVRIELEGWCWQHVKKLPAPGGMDSHGQMVFFSQQVYWLIGSLVLW